MDIKAEEFLHKLQNKLPLPQATQVYVVFGEDDYYRSQITAAPITIPIRILINDKNPVL